MAPFQVFPHFGKLGRIKKYPLLYPFYMVLSVFWVVVVVSWFLELILGFAPSFACNFG